MAGATADDVDVTVVVPAYEEAGRIGTAVRELVAAYEVLVVDDGSRDDTTAEARAAGAAVVVQPENRGYMCALRRGFRAAAGDVVVTYDGDGENRPEDVPRLVEPVATGDADLVLGARGHVPRRSERALNALVDWRTGVGDAYTGFRAIRRDLATSLDLDSTDNCGTLVVQAHACGARITEVPIRLRAVEKPRGVAWDHWRHAVRILRAMREGAGGRPGAHGRNR